MRLGLVEIGFHFVEQAVDFDQRCVQVGGRKQAFGAKHGNPPRQAVVRRPAVRTEELVCRRHVRHRRSVRQHARRLAGRASIN